MKPTGVARRTIAAMAGDVGSYFQRLTKRGRGGRRLDDGRRTDSTRRDDEHDDRREPSAKRSSSGRRSGGAFADVLQDVLGRGRTAARKTAERGRPSRKRPARTRRLPPEGVVHVEYSPRMDGDPDPGEVVWAWVPFEEDPEQGKDRPVVVIGRRGRKLVGVPLTTKRSEREAQVAIGTGDWDPKRRQSYARIWRMLDLEPDGMRREGSILDRRRFDQVIVAVDEYYDVRRPIATG